MEYWMASNETGHNGSEEALVEVLQDPGSAVLFIGYPRWLLHFAASCCILFMLVGIPGNLFTIIALSCTKKLRNATAIFIMNLSVSDLMFCCFNLPLATSTFWHSSWRHGAFLCRLFPLLRYGLVAVSLFTVLAITINRYVMIGHPRLYPTLYKTKYLIPMILSTWIIAFGILIVTWFENWGRFGLDTAIGSCSILPDVNGRSPKEFLFVVAFLIPCIAIVVCYARIFYIVRKTASKSRKQHPRVNANAVEVNHERRSLSSKNQEEELSVPGSSYTASVLCPNQPNRINNSRSPSRSAMEESISEIQESWEHEPTKEDASDYEERILKCPDSKIWKEKDGKENLDEDRELSVLRVVEICDKGSPSLEIKIDDIPYVDERDDLDVEEDVFSNIERNKIKDSSVKASVNARNKLERMASRASFIIESAFWVQRLNSKVSSGSDRLESSRSNTPERSIKKQPDVPRRGSRIRSVKRYKSPENGPRMTNKDKKLLKIILVIFSSFLICYLPITIAKTFKDAIYWRGFNIAGYVLIYLTTCINPIVYVVMSSEYRSAYKNVLLCKNVNELKVGNRTKNVVR